MTWNLDYIKALKESLEKEGHELDKRSEDCEVCTPLFTPGSYYGAMINATIGQHNQYTNATVNDCENCGETSCEWLEYNDGICCGDSGNLEYPKYCPPCTEDKTADMIDTARDIEKDRML